MFSVLLAYLSMWGLAGPQKLFAGGPPEWFVGQFGETFLASFPGLGASFFSLALGETVAAALALVALVRGEFLSGKTKTFTLLTLVVSLLLFVQLGFGLRLVSDFDGAAKIFFYFGATLVALMFTQAEEK